MSCCDWPRITQDMGFYVCMSCGTQQTRSVFIKPSTYGRCPSRPPYSRKKRFLKLLHNVWACRLPRMKEAFIRTLVDSKPESSDHIMSFIRGTKNRSFKRYDCIAKLSQKLLNHEIESLSQHQICFCVGVFQKIEERHRQVRGVFPAYSFIIEYCLLHPFVNRPDLVGYLHLLKCPRRRAMYKRVYGICFHRSS